NFADGGHQVEQIGFHGAERRIVGAAVFPSAALPALPLLTERMGRHHMLPFQARRAGGLGTRTVSAALQIDAPARAARPGPVAAAIRGAQRALVPVMPDQLA